ncbi:MAG: aldehyde dehydrogenase family protein [Pseudobdellovibrionaceae bacterium]|nr:aldehyde dehydrogenase family protein [Pseudobdellovibrionaceae bacterium]
MGISTLPSFVAGKRIEADSDRCMVRSLDDEIAIPVAEISAADLRNALRYADRSQEILARTSLAERIEVARLLIREYANRRNDVAWGLARFRGLVARDTHWMCDLMLDWDHDLDALVLAMFGVPAAAACHAIYSRENYIGSINWTSRGKTALFSASTMDGPAGITALAHGIISGTHLLIRPSWRDPATHLGFEILQEHGLSHYAQLVRWRSDGENAAMLNRLLLSNVDQALIFSSNETFSQLVGGTSAPGTPAWEHAFRKARRYGTGLPLAIVTAEFSPETAAKRLIEGARLGAGRFCLSTTPVLVQDSAYDPLLKHLKKEAALLTRGDPLSFDSDLSGVAKDEVLALKQGLANFGGKIEYGEIRHDGMDVMIVGDVPEESPCLYEEFPGTLLCLIRVPDLKTAGELAKAGLRKNGREAWTAVTTFGSVDQYETVVSSLPSFRHLHAGITSHVKLLMPHQGSYFALDMMRRMTREPFR